jgi:uncharacterized membrane protein
MGTARHRSEVSASRHRAFTYVNDYEHVPDWMFGVKKFEPVSEVTYGLGSRFNVVMSVGPKALSATVEVTEFVEDEVVRLETIKGLTATTEWRFEDTGKGTAVSVEVTYQLPGGIAGRALGAVIEPAVGQVIRHTDSALKSRLDKPE